MEKKFRIKMLEPFKDGNILGGRFLKVGEVLIVTEREAELIESSGGLLERIEMVIPNPLKQVVSDPQAVDSYKEAAPAVGAPKKGQTVSKPRKGKK